MSKALLISTLSHIVTFIFNRLTYIILNVLVIYAFISSYGIDGVKAYFALGFMLAPFVANIDFNRQKLKFEYEMEMTFRWYYYIPFFLADIVVWVYAVMGLTGDSIFGFIQSDIEKTKTQRKSRE